MESQIKTPLYGSVEASHYAADLSKGDIAATQGNLDRLPPHGNTAEKAIDSAEIEIARMDNIASRLGGTILPREIQDPRV